MTRNDLYAYLISEGVRRNYLVMGEFVVHLSEDKSKKIDLVWATRNGHPGPQDADNVGYWDLKAIFEIEGCNIRNWPNEFMRHISSFPVISELYGPDVQKFVVLYTSAYDRDWNHNLTQDERDAEVQIRVAWGGQIVTVLNGRVIANEIQARFPIPQV